MPTKTMKPRSTRNSGPKSIFRLRSGLDRIDRGRNRLGIGGAPAEPLDDRARSLSRDLGDVGHRFGAGRRDLLLRLGEPRRQLILQRLALGRRFGGGLVASGLGRRVSL